MPRTRTNNTLLRRGIQPDQIRLPDGRVYNIAELQNRISRRRSHNLVTGRTSGGATGSTESTAGIPVHLQVNFTAPNIKYTVEERLWQSENSIEDIQARYDVPSFKQAKTIKYRANTIVNHLRRTGVLPSGPDPEDINTTEGK